MTEQEWLASLDPRPMLALVNERANARKVRMFLVACARARWGDSEDEAMRMALDATEQLAESADPLAISELRIGKGEAVIDCGGSHVLPELWGRGGMPRTILAKANCPILQSIFARLACVKAMTFSQPWLDGVCQLFDQEGFGLARQAVVVRDVFRGPFRPIVFRAAWRTRRLGAAHGVAQAIYEEEAFGDLPVLADALEEVGCDERDILDHLRGAGPHCRGCWPVDLILGKQ